MRCVCNTYTYMCIDEWNYVEYDACAQKFLIDIIINFSFFALCAVSLRGYTLQTHSHARSLSFFPSFARARWPRSCVLTQILRTAMLDGNSNKYAYGWWKSVECAGFVVAVVAGFFAAIAPCVLSYRPLWQKPHLVTLS